MAPSDRTPSADRFPRIRSFVRREGKLTRGQARALENLWSVYGIDYQPQLLDLPGIFGRRAPLVLEIGFGNGDALLHSAQQHPENNFLGIEVHRPGVGSLLLRAEQSALKNLRVLRHDAVEVVEHCIEDHSLAEVRIFFPDPWPKKRHHKRRLVQGDFIHKLSRTLATDGRLHLATDWEEYAQQMLQVLCAERTLKNIHPDSKFAPRPESRPETRFEKRGQLLGHGVWDLLFVKIQNIAD